MKIKGKFTRVVKPNLARYDNSPFPGSQNRPVQRKDHGQARQVRAWSGMATQGSGLGLLRQGAATQCKDRGSSMHGLAWRRNARLVARSVQARYGNARIMVRHGEFRQRDARFSVRSGRLRQG